MLELIIVRGLPGSGKSTFANKLSRMFDYMHYEADMFFMNTYGEYEWSGERLAQAHTWCMDSCRNSLELGVSVSNTFVTNSQMAPYILMAKKYNAKLTVITCEGDYGNVHDVPKATIERMRAKWEPYANG